MVKVLKSFVQSFKEFQSNMSLGWGKRFADGALLKFQTFQISSSLDCTEYDSILLKSRLCLRLSRDMLDQITFP